MPQSNNPVKVLSRSSGALVFGLFTALLLVPPAEAQIQLPSSGQSSADLTFVNFFYVQPQDVFSGLKLSFFALTGLYEEGARSDVLLEAFSVESVGSALNLEPRGTWSLTLTRDDFIAPAQMEFLLPHFTMIMKEVDAEFPSPFGRSMFLVKMTMALTEIRDLRIFPNFLLHPSGANVATFVDMGDGEMQPDLNLEQLQELLPPQGQDDSPDVAFLRASRTANLGGAPSAPAMGAAASGLALQVGRVAGGTHIMIHAHPRMAAP